MEPNQERGRGLENDKKKDQIDKNQKKNSISRVGAGGPTRRERKKEKKTRSVIRHTWRSTTNLRTIYNSKKKAKNTGKKKGKPIHFQNSRTKLHCKRQNVGSPSIRIKRSGRKTRNGAAHHEIEGGAKREEEN